MTRSQQLKDVMKSAFEDVWVTQVGIDMLKDVQPITEAWLAEKDHATTDEQRRIIGAAMRTFIALVFLTAAEQLSQDHTRN